MVPVIHLEDVAGHRHELHHLPPDEPTARTVAGRVAGLLGRVGDPTRWAGAKVVVIDARNNTLVFSARVVAPQPFCPEVTTERNGVRGENNSRLGYTRDTIMGILSDTKRTFTEAGAEIGVSERTLRKWHDRGVKGVKLEAVYLGRRLFTSKEAVVRFLKKLNPDTGTAGTGAV